jgi:hypothetical protein
VNIDSYSEDGVWIKIPFFEMMSKGSEETFDQLVEFTTGMELVEQYDDEEENAKYALFR